MLTFDKTSYRSQWFVSLWFGLVVSILCKLILISYHNLLAILVRGYVCCRVRFISFIFTVYSSVDVRPLTPGLGPSQKMKSTIFMLRLLQMKTGYGTRSYLTLTSKL